MKRPAKRNVLAATSLLAALASFTFSGAKAAEIFPEELETALSDQPTSRPEKLPYDERNISFAGGVAFLALAYRQRRKEVVANDLDFEALLVKQEVEEVIKYLGEVSVHITSRLAEIDNRLSIYVEPELTWSSQSPDEHPELAEVIILETERPDHVPPQPPAPTPNYTAA